MLPVGSPDANEKHNTQKERGFRAMKPSVHSRNATHVSLDDSSECPWAEVESILQFRKSDLRCGSPALKATSEVGQRRTDGPEPPAEILGLARRANPGSTLDAKLRQPYIEHQEHAYFLVFGHRT
jgi:hypothetical protein